MKHSALFPHSYTVQDHPERVSLLISEQDNPPRHVERSISQVILDFVKLTVLAIVLPGLILSFEDYQVHILDSIVQKIYTSC